MVIAHEREGSLPSDVPGKSSTLARVAIIAVAVLTILAIITTFVLVVLSSPESPADCVNGIFSGPACFR